MTANYDPRHTSYKAPADTGPTIADVDQELKGMSDRLLKHYADDLNQAEITSKHWEALPVEQRKAMRANNELARRANVKEREEAKAAETAKAEAAQQALIDAKIATYKARAQGAFPGSAAQFEAAWPDLLRSWQVESTRALLDADKDAVRARMSGF